MPSDVLQEFRFREALWPGMAPFALAVVAAFGAAWVLLGGRGRDLPAAAFVVAALIAGLTVVISFVVIREVRIGPEGIRLYRRHFLRWEDITRARRSSVVGLHFVQVSLRKKPLDAFIPLHWTDPAGFVRAVLECAPPGNPIRACLEPTGPQGAGSSAPR